VYRALNLCDWKLIFEHTPTKLLDCIRFFNERKLYVWQAKLFVSAPSFVAILLSFLNKICSYAKEDDFEDHFISYCERCKPVRSSEREKKKKRRKTARNHILTPSTDSVDYYSTAKHRWGRKPDAIYYRTIFEWFQWTVTDTSVFTLMLNGPTRVTLYLRGLYWHPSSRLFAMQCG
jgi:hypothetical protein